MRNRKLCRGLLLAKVGLRCGGVVVQSDCCGPMRCQRRIKEPTPFEVDGVAEKPDPGKGAHLIK